MKTITLILIYLLLLAGVSCKKATPPDNTEATSQTAAHMTAGPPEANDPSGGKIILHINQQTFNNNDFKQFLATQHPDISQTSNGTSKKLLSRLFDSFVEHKTILHIAKQYDIPVNQSELDQYIEKLNLTPTKIDLNSVIEIVKVQKYLYSKVYAPINVSEKEIRNYYNKHLAEFRKKSEVLLYQILVKDNETAVKIRGILNNNPKKFEEIAQTESISIEAQKGGLMGYFEKGILPKDMEQAVFSLSPNTISPVMKSAYGYHIFKISKKKKGRLLYLDKVKPQLKQKLLSEKLRAAYMDFLAKARMDLAIIVKQSGLYFDYQITKADKEAEKGDHKNENKEISNTSNPDNSSH